MGRGIKRKCEQPNIEDKYNAIMQVEKKLKKKSEIAKELNVGNSTVSGWFIPETKAKIIEEYENNPRPEKKLG